MPTPVRAATPKPLKPKPRKGSYKVVKPTSVALRLVRPWIVDRIVRWAQRSNDICDEVNRALTEVFGTPPKDGWRDSDGFDCNERDVDGFDKDGFDQFGYDPDGYNFNGWSRYGWNSAGVNAWGMVRNSIDVENLLKYITPAMREGLYQELAKDHTSTQQPAE
jgi:hypothetical protein